MILRNWRGWLTVLLFSLPQTPSAAEPLSGEQLFAVACEACHSMGGELDHRIGPPLGGLRNRQAATVAGYSYSKALLNTTWTWNLPTVVAWLSDPDGAVPNNAMNYVNALSATETQRLAEWLLQEAPN